MSLLFTEGKVITDLQLKWSERSKRHYVYFTLVETIGYGEQKRDQYYQVWAFGSDAEHLVNRKVGKHSRVWIFGSAELAPYERRDGTKEKGLKLYMTEWGFESDGVPKVTLVKEPSTAPTTAVPPQAAKQESAPIEVVRGDKDTLPE